MILFEGIENIFDSVLALPTEQYVVRLLFCASKILSFMSPELGLYRVFALYRVLASTLQ